MNTQNLLVICTAVPTWLLPPDRWQLPKVFPTVGAPKIKAQIETAGVTAIYVEGKEFKPDGPLRQKLCQSGWKPPQAEAATAAEFEKLAPGTEIIVLVAASGGHNANHILWRRSSAVRIEPQKA